MSDMEEYKRYLKKCDMLGVRMFNFAEVFDSEISIVKYLSNKDTERLVKIPEFVSYVAIDTFRNINQRLIVDGRELKSIGFQGYMGDKINLENLDTSEVEYMSIMFRQCRHLKELDLSNFDTSKVKDMYQMFEGCRELEKINLSSFDTSNVYDMSRMFIRCNRLKKLDLNSFDTHNVKDMGHMFMGCSSLEELHMIYLDTSKVENPVQMFAGCENLKLIKTNMAAKEWLNDNREMIALNHHCVIDPW